MVEIRPTLPGDSWLVLARLRAIEAQEFAALGLDPGEQLRLGMRDGQAETLFINGECAGIFGVIRDEDTCLPWGLFTDTIEKYPTAFLRACRRWINARPEVLANEVDARNTTALKWFEWMGFRVGPPEPMGLAGELFHPIERRPVTRETVMALERAILRDLPPVALTPVHHFAPGLYARELFIPKGTVLTGKIHRTCHLNVISQGDISVLTEHGVKRLKAPCTLISQPGIKRAGYAHEDTVWTTFHPTTLTDLDEIEREVIAPDFSEFATIGEDRVCLGS